MEGFVMKGFFGDINKDNKADFHYEDTDHLMQRVIWWHVGAVALWLLIVYILRPADYYPSPFSWHNLTLAETLGGIALALFAGFLPQLFRVSTTNHYAHRILVTASLSALSFLIVFASGGAIEAHFHIFVVLALVTLYYDWRLPWFVFGLVIAHRLIFNYIEPQWIYHYGQNDSALFAHTFFVLLAVIFAVLIANQGRRAIQTIAQANDVLAKKAGL